MRRGIRRDRISKETREQARVRAESKKVIISIFIIVLCVLAFLVYNLLIESQIWERIKELV